MGPRGTPTIHRIVQAPLALVVARILWIVPVILLALSIHQANVALDIRSTLRNGQPAMASVTDFESAGRVDVTYDYVSLAVDIDGKHIVHEKMSLPHTFAPYVQGMQEIEVLVQPGADQEIVIRDLGRAHYRIAAINSLMALVAALLLGAGVGYWHWYVKKKGDPGSRTATQTVEMAP